MSSDDSHPVTKYIGLSAWSMIAPRFSDYAKKTLVDLIDFLETECLPAQNIYHHQLSKDPAKRWKSIPPILLELQDKAKSRGLWNLFLSKKHYPEHGVDLTNLEYSVMAEISGNAPFIMPAAINCAAPDTGNMEVFARYGTPAQQKKYLLPLLDGKIRSAFAMTEPGVASSDATNLQRTRIEKAENGDVVINGRKWWISGAGDPRCAVHILVGMSDPQNPSPHKRHTIVLIPADHPGVKVVRPMQVFGYDDAPEGHCEIIYDNVRVKEKDCLVGGWGRGFEILQGRLGPGRIHHCMRSIGTASHALDLMLERVSDPKRKTFGKFLKDHGTIIADIAKSRSEIEGARMLVLSAAHRIDQVRAKGAMKDIGIAKFVVPQMALGVVDRAMQSFGAEGLCQDQNLAQMYGSLRVMRYADGPDEVHEMQIGKAELKRVPELNERSRKVKERESALEAKSRL